jgi:hypothetical protein
MDALGRHLRRHGAYGPPPFRSDCPICRDERLDGRIPEPHLAGPRMRAGLVAGMLAISTIGAQSVSVARADAIDDAIAQVDQATPPGDPLEANGGDNGDDAVSDAGDEAAGDTGDGAEGQPASGPQPAEQPQPASDPTSAPASDPQPVEQPQQPQQPQSAQQSQPPAGQQPAPQLAPDPRPAPPADPEPGPAPDSQPARDPQSAPAPDPPPPATGPQVAPAPEPQVLPRSKRPWSRHGRVPSHAAPDSRPPPIAQHGAADDLAATHGSDAERADLDNARASSLAPAVARQARRGEARRSWSSRPNRYTVQPGDCLWSIARRVLAAGASDAAVAAEVDRLWRLNAGAIGTGSPDLIEPGQVLRLR